MSEKIIYEKKYPRLSWEEELKLAEDVELPDNLNRPFDEIYEEIAGSFSYVPIPKRRKESKEFIQLAVLVSDMYDLDINVTRHDHYIAVKYTFPAGYCPHDIRYVFAMADECDFDTANEGKDVVINLDYHTHALVRDGRIVSPDIDKEDFYL